MEDRPRRGFPRVDDWSRPSFRSACEELGITRYRKGVFDRLDWQRAICLEGLRLQERIRPDAMILFVAAGTDPTIFVLSRYCKAVYATDLYDGHWASAPRRFVEAPSSFGRIGGASERIIALRADACHLPFEQDRFDVTLCLGPSINYFGGRHRAVEALGEMARVTRPGGLIAGVIEVALEGRGNRIIFDAGFAATLLTSAVSVRSIAPVVFDTSGLVGLPTITGVVRFPPPQPNVPQIILRTPLISRTPFSRPRFAPFFFWLGKCGVEGHLP